MSKMIEIYMEQWIPLDVDTKKAFAGLDELA